LLSRPYLEPRATCAWCPLPRAAIGATMR
jgi:hypothetical protein